MVQSLRKTTWKLFKKLKAELLYDPSIPLLDINGKELKVGPQGCIFAHPHSQQHYLQQIKGEKSPNCPWTDKWLSKCHIYIQWNIRTLSEISQSQRQILYDFIYMKHLK